MATFGDGFELSKWFNGMSTRQEGASSDNTDIEDVEAVQSPDEEEPVVVVEVSRCFVCRTLNPEYWSTNAVKGMPSVPVCSLECEAAYLEQKGVKADKKNSGRYTELPVSPTDASDGPPPAKKAKRGSEIVMQTPDDAATSKRPRRAFSFLDEHMLEADEGKGYKSWWLGALAFYDFVYQRHGMWHCYSMGNNEPRVDPSLIKYWSCNVYRELDRSTAYLRKHVIRWQQSHQGRLSLREVLWMAVVFRYCNKLETFDKTQGIPSSDAFPNFKKRMQTLSKRNDADKLFAGRRDLDVARYLEVLEDFLDNLDACTFEIKRCSSASDVFEELRKFGDNALGSFTCWQVVCDLMELKMLSDEFEADDYVWLSVDAKKSLLQIFGKRRARPSEYASLAKLLQQRQVQGFKALQVRFPYFMNQKVNLKNIGHALHGFQVYRNIKLLEQGQFQKHEHGTTAPVPYASRSYLMDKETCEVCSAAENEDELVLCDMCNSMYHKYCISMTELPPASWVCSACTKLVNLPEQGLVAEQEVISIE